MFTVRSRLVASALVLTLGLPASAAEPTPTADAPTRAAGLHGHRYAFVAGGLFLIGGATFGYLAQGEANRARTLSSARESGAALDRARTHAATANVLYAMAGATVLYGLVLELLPEPAAEKASLTFHF
ncbi:hypothetical protein [Archangium violaceum]|uniref:Uncharacterized protein n=1 Tax=Archangium violaceum Cb vi76 TaxID=1406225 RepID=A0A084SJ45_9BACT|nr:hypothetical protein [Archangium violaceum]KFA88480.1 hypothetical protein Q664_41430 [Archangium violaceum Cb vi76]